MASVTIPLLLNDVTGGARRAEVEGATVREIIASLELIHPGIRAKVLVDTGHHYSAQNIEQIVAWLIDEEMLGGFHFNDRRYADDDLTVGSIDPYQMFRAPSSAN